MKGIIALGCIALSMFVTFVYGDSIPSKESNVKISVESLKTSSDNDWENPHIIAINKEPASATFIPYGSIEEMQ